MFYRLLYNKKRGKAYFFALTFNNRKGTIHLDNSFIVTQCYCSLSHAWSNHACNADFSLRAQFAVENEPINQLHGSASHEEAQREINFFFPQQKTLAVIKPDAMEQHRGPLRT